MPRFTAVRVLANATTVPEPGSLALIGLAGRVDRSAAQVEGLMKRPWRVRQDLVMAQGLKETAASGPPFAHWVSPQWHYLKRMQPRCAVAAFRDVRARCCEVESTTDEVLAVA